MNRPKLGILIAALATALHAQATPSPTARCRGIGVPDDASAKSAAAIARAQAAFRESLPTEFRNAPFDRLYKLIQKPATEKLPSELANDPTVPANFARIRREYPEYLAGYDRYLGMLGDYESRMYAEADPSSGPEALRPALLRARARELATALALEILLDPKIEENGKIALLARLEDLQVFTLSSLRDIADDTTRNQAWFLMSMACGPAYSAVNAFASFLPEDLVEDPNQSLPYRPGAKLRPVLVVCPGLISLAAPLAERRHGLDFVLAHEISHLLTLDPVAAVSPDASKDPRNLDPSLTSTHAPILACVDAGHAKEMSTLAEIVEKLRPAVEAYRVEALNDVMKMFSAPAEAGYSTQVQAWKYALGAFLGHEPTAAESHAPEILADYWATRILAPVAAKAARDGVPLADAVRPYLAWICAVPSPAAFPDGDEGLHPPLAFRFDQFLRHPAFRDAAFETAGIPRPAGKWCDLQSP